jgi:hypothetical protein
MSTIVSSATIIWLAAILVAAYLLGRFVGRREREAAALQKSVATSEHFYKSVSGQPKPGTAAFTILSALNGRGCLGRSKPEEPVFVLCARDKAASMVVRQWADFAHRLGASAEKVKGAYQVAADMSAWREAHGGGKIPD